MNFGLACANPERVGVCVAAIVPDQNRVIPFVRPKPIKPVQPPVFNVPVVVLAVIAILVGIHGLLALLGQDWQVWSLYALSFIPARLLNPEVIAAPVGASIWSFFTYALLHGNWTHVMFNAVWMFIFATPVARKLGTMRTLIFMAGTVIAGAAAMLPLHWGETITVVGASAAVSGLMAAAIPIMYSPGFDRNQQDLSGFRVLTFAALMQDKGALGFTAVFFGMQLLTGAVQANSMSAFLNESSIAWEAHVGGFVAGLAIFYLLERRRIPTSRFM
jgi:membrane associated rhomboid family serine protease